MAQTTFRTPRAVVVWKDPVEQGYRVSIQGKKDCRLFIWGSFDEGDVSWQQARSQAFAYARNEAAKIGGQVIKLKNT